MRVLLRHRVIPCWVRWDRAMVPPEGRVRGICRDTIYCNGNHSETEAKTLLHSGAACWAPCPQDRNILLSHVVILSSEGPAFVFSSLATSSPCPPCFWGKKCRRISTRRPIRRFIMPRGSELVRRASVRQHGPDLARPAARGFEYKMPAIGRPGGPLVPSGISGEFANLV
jgi:hypothetical protein